MALLAITAGNLANAKLRVEGANRADDAGAIEWGPMHPDAVAMFDAVEQLTRADDVIAAPKARAMVLETGRPSIQVDDFRPIPPDVNVSLLVVERSTRLASTIAADGRWTAVWDNARFVLYRVQSREQLAERFHERSGILVDRLAVQLDLGLGATGADLDAHATFEIEAQQIGLRVLGDAQHLASADLGRRRGRLAARAPWRRRRRVTSGSRRRRGGGGRTGWRCRRARSAASRPSAAATAAISANSTAAEIPSLSSGRLATR